MTARNHLLALLLASVFATPASAQQADTGTPDRTLTERLSEWDQSYARLKREIWNLQRVTSMFGRDFRGRTLSDDLRDFVLTQPTEKRLSEQRALVTTQLAKSETQPATETLVALYRSLRDELERIDQIGTHRMRHARVARQRELWQQLASKVAGYQTPDNIRTLEQQSVERLNAGRFEETSRTTYAALLHAYATERAQLIIKAPRSNVLIYERRSPCGEPATITTGRAGPALASKTIPHYPATSKRAGEEGTVYLQLLVSKVGCVARYAIQFSFGWPALDDAALDWTETLQFDPAGPDGKATDTWVTLPVIFRLDD